jgi:hypothetical protein
VVVLNFCVWSFPDLTAQVVNLLPLDVPILLVGNIMPSHPGWVAFFASAGTLDEIGRPFGRVLGDIRHKSVQAEVDRFLQLYEPDQRARGEQAALNLRRPTLWPIRWSVDGDVHRAHRSKSQWMDQFGVHVYHRGQLHLWSLAQKIAEDRVEAGSGLAGEALRRNPVGRQEAHARVGRYPCSAGADVPRDEGLLQSSRGSTSAA